MSLPPWLSPYRRPLRRRYVTWLVNGGQVRLEWYAAPAGPSGRPAALRVTCTQAMRPYATLALITLREPAAGEFLRQIVRTGNAVVTDAIGDLTVDFADDEWDFVVPSYWLLSRVCDMPSVWDFCMLWFSPREGAMKSGRSAATWPKRSATPVGGYEN